MATYNAASPSYADVISAYTLASDGDTITIPAGNAYWGPTERLQLTKWINLIGAGKGLTNIYGSSNEHDPSDPRHYLISFWPSSYAGNLPLRISGISLDPGTDGHCMYLYNNTMSVCNRVRIDHCSLTVPGLLTGGTQVGYVFVRRGPLFGVMDNCDVYGGNIDMGGNYLIFFDAGNVYNFGDANNFYIEDCNISYSTWGRPVVSAGNGPNRYAFRHNIFDCAGSWYSPLFDLHGNQPAQAGCQGVEIYENTVNFGTITNPGATYRLYNQRGGKSLVYNNTFTATGSWNPIFQLQEEHDDGATPPAPAVHSVSLQPMHISDTYYWNNTVNSIRLDPTVVTYLATCSYCGLGVPQANIHFWVEQTSFDGTVGMGRGTIASRPFSGTPGVGYWATDQNILYRVKSDGTWEMYYVPYTYPHPLRGEAAASIDVSGSAVSASAASGSASLVRDTAASDYLEDAVLDHVFKVAAYTVPTNIYVALCKSTIDDTHTGSTLPGEATGGGYVRTLCNTWSIAADGLVSNENPVIFPSATADWGTITDIAICDSQTVGEVLVYGKLFNYKAVEIGDIMEFEAGGLQVTLD